MAAMTAHKVSTWENRCGEINTPSDTLLAAPRHFSAPVKYGGVVLRKRSLARGGEEMKSFVRHPKTSEGVTEVHRVASSLKKETKSQRPSGQRQEGRTPVVSSI